MSEHKHGTMDTRVQQKTFENFITATVRSGIAILVIVVILAFVGA